LTAGFAASQWTEQCQESPASVEQPALCHHLPPTHFVAQESKAPTSTGKLLTGKGEGQYGSRRKRVKDPQLGESSSSDSFRIEMDGPALRPSAARGAIHRALQVHRRG
jgi:hypothetical protein